MIWVQLFQSLSEAIGQMQTRIVYTHAYNCRITVCERTEFKCILLHFNTLSHLEDLGQHSLLLHYELFHNAKGHMWQPW